MQVTLRGGTFVRADREAVWAALHDTAVIARCVPGCHSLARASESLFVLSSRIAVGPLRLVVSGTVELADCDPPQSYCLIGRSSGGSLDASGRVCITLAEQRGGCRLDYAVEADARGLFAGAGPVMMSGIGRGITAYFASRFGDLVERRGPETR